MTVDQLSIAAKAAVLDQIERAYESHCIDEQINRTTNPDVAEVHHAAAVRLLRARMVEEDENPRLEPAITRHCLTCAAAYAANKDLR